MHLFKELHSHGLHGFHMLEAHLDWLIHITDTLGHGMHSHHAPQLVDECLKRLLAGMPRLFDNETLLFAEIGQPLHEAQLQAQHRLMFRLTDLARRHSGGEDVGAQLLEQMQSWLLEHCDRRSAITLQ